MSCITLLSDFGLKDASVAVAKGILMQHNPGIPIVDISHEVSVFHTAQAAYLLGCSYKNFPAGTYHVLLFDLFAESSPHLVLSKHNGHFFLTPDNEVVPMALGMLPGNAWLCFEMNGKNTFTEWLNQAGAVIHDLASKKKAETDLPPYQMKINRKQLTPAVKGNTAECDILHIDHYGNVVLNITRPLFDTLCGSKPFQLQFSQVEEITEINNTYGEVREGYKLCRFNSNGYMEICINRGSAANLFGLRLGSRHNNIKLFFE